MKSKNSVTEEELRSLKLWFDARKLTAVQVQSLEEQLQLEQSDMDIRVQLLSHYHDRQMKHMDSEEKLFEQLLWITANKPFLSFSLGHRIAVSAISLKPKRFAMVREALLEQVSLHPLEGTIFGNAAMFIVWKDFETGSRLFERAYELEPTFGWLGYLVIHCNARLDALPNLYADEIHEQIIDVGLRSLRFEVGGAPFLTCEYVSDAALAMGRLDIVLWCADILSNLNDTRIVQMANAYIGLVALRENDPKLAIQMLIKTYEYDPHRVMFRLATELFAIGERESITGLIYSLKSKIKKSMRNRWIEQIANDELPDFDELCC